MVPVAFCGTESDYLKEIRVETGGRLGQGPTGTCVRENRPVINDNFATNSTTLPWREQALIHGFHASAAFPRAPPGQGRRRIHALRPRADAFDAEQIGLLDVIERRYLLCP